MTAADRPPVTAPDGLPCCGACEGFPECTCGNEGTDCRTAADSLMPLIHQAQAQALKDFADSTRFPSHWILFRREDGSGVTVSDLLRETAARYRREAGGRNG